MPQALFGPSETLVQIREVVVRRQVILAPLNHQLELLNSDLGERRRALVIRALTLAVLLCRVEPAEMFRKISGMAIDVAAPGISNTKIAVGEKAVGIDGN